MSDKNISFKAIRTMLVEQLERLNDDVETCSTREGIENEVARSKAMVEIASSITEMSRVQLDAYKLASEFNYTQKDMPLLLN